MKTTEQRLEDRIKLVSEELELTRQEHSRNLQHERDRCNEEIQRLKDEHASLMNALLERNMTQSKEIATLQSLITTLRAELTTQRKELQEAYVFHTPYTRWQTHLQYTYNTHINTLLMYVHRYEASLREVKESERRRAEELMADLRQRYCCYLVSSNVSILCS